MNWITVISILLFVLFLIPVGYLYILAIASIRPARVLATVFRKPTTRFMIAIPAHNEENVIQDTVAKLLSLNYPRDLFNVHIVADYCTDGTAALATQAGAIVHERNEGPRSGKGAALSWVFQQALQDNTYDAVVVFDADTQVEPNFLRIADARLAQGNKAVQGQHIISNPEQGWFPALTWAMFLVDNRYQNLGRSNLGWSAKNMGDSICLRADLLQQLGWGEGLTEDYHLRQRLLLDDIKITYEPSAKGFGEAALTWSQARAQRARWLRGTQAASREFGKKLLVEGIRRRNGALIDGALQSIFPSYSTLTLINVVILAMHILINLFPGTVSLSSVLYLWTCTLLLLFIYPFPGLFFERAPTKAYLVMLSGSIFIIWRTWLAFSSRFVKKTIPWIRTEHGKRAQ